MKCWLPHRYVAGSWTTIWVQIEVDPATMDVEIAMTTLGKKPTMIGESTMVTFQPAPALKPPLSPTPPRSDVPDLVGLWTSTASGKERYLFSGPAGRQCLRCLTADAQTSLGGKASGCAFSTGACSLDASTVSCKLDNGTTITGALSQGKDAISFGDGGWSKFTGRLSGLWYGPTNTKDYYVITHDSRTNNVTVWWDTTMSAAEWVYSTSGSLEGMSLSLELKGFWEHLTGTVNADFTRIAWVGSAGTWNRHQQQWEPNQCGEPARFRSGASLHSAVNSVVLGTGRFVLLLLNLLVALCPGVAQRRSAWSIDKLGGAVDPEGVQDGGNQFNHGSWGGTTVVTTAGSMRILALVRLRAIVRPQSFTHHNKDNDFGETRLTGLAGRRQSQSDDSHVSYRKCTACKL